jgi:hypothetical protein
MQNKQYIAIGHLVEIKIPKKFGRIQDFKLGGAHLKKLRRAEGATNIFGVFRVKNVIRRHYILLLKPSDVRAHYIRKTADLPHQLWVRTFPRFVAIGFY